MAHNNNSNYLDPDFGPLYASGVHQNDSLVPEDSHGTNRTPSFTTSNVKNTPPPSSRKSGGSPIPLSRKNTSGVAGGAVLGGTQHPPMPTGPPPPLSTNSAPPSQTPSSAVRVKGPPGPPSAMTPKMVGNATTPLNNNNNNNNNNIPGIQVTGTTPRNSVPPRPATPQQNNNTFAQSTPAAPLHQPVSQQTPASSAHNLPKAPPPPPSSVAVTPKNGSAAAQQPQPSQQFPPAPSASNTTTTPAAAPTLVNASATPASPPTKEKSKKELEKEQKAELQRKQSAAIQEYYDYLNRQNGVIPANTTTAATTTDSNKKEIQQPRLIGATSIPTPKEDERLKQQQQQQNAQPQFAGPHPNASTATPREGGLQQGSGRKAPPPITKPPSRHQTPDRAGVVQRPLATSNSSNLAGTTRNAQGLPTGPPPPSTAAAPVLSGPPPLVRRNSTTPTPTQQQALPTGPPPPLESSSPSSRWKTATSAVQQQNQQKGDRLYATSNEAMEAERKRKADEEKKPAPFVPMSRASKDDNLYQQQQQQSSHNLSANASVAGGDATAKKSSPPPLTRASSQKFGSSRNLGGPGSPQRSPRSQRGIDRSRSSNDFNNNNSNNTRSRIPGETHTAPSVSVPGMNQRMERTSWQYTNYQETQYNQRTTAPSSYYPSNNNNTNDENFVLSPKPLGKQNYMDRHRREELRSEAFHREERERRMLPGTSREVAIQQQHQENPVPASSYQYNTPTISILVSIEGTVPQAGLLMRLVDIDPHRSTIHDLLINVETRLGFFGTNNNANSNKNIQSQAARQKYSTNGLLLAPARNIAVQRRVQRGPSGSANAMTAARFGGQQQPQFDTTTDPENDFTIYDLLALPSSAVVCDIPLMDGDTVVWRERIRPVEQVKDIWVLTQQQQQQQQQQQSRMNQVSYQDNSFAYQQQPHQEPQQQRDAVHYLQHQRDSEPQRHHQQHYYHRPVSTPATAANSFGDPRSGLVVAQAPSQHHYRDQQQESLLQSTPTSFQDPQFIPGSRISPSINAFYSRQQQQSAKNSNNIVGASARNSSSSLQSPSSPISTRMLEPENEFSSFYGQSYDQVKYFEDKQKRQKQQEFIRLRQEQFMREQREQGLLEQNPNSNQHRGFGADRTNKSNSTTSNMKVY